MYNDNFSRSFIIGFLLRPWGARKTFCKPYTMILFFLSGVFHFLIVLLYCLSNRYTHALCFLKIFLLLPRHFESLTFFLKFRQLSRSLTFHVMCLSVSTVKINWVIASLYVAVLYFTFLSSGTAVIGLPLLWHPYLIKYLIFFVLVYIYILLFCIMQWGKAN